MTGVSITEHRLKKMCFSHAYLESQLRLRHAEKFSHLYTSLNDILKKPNVRLVVRKGTSYEALARTLVPESKLVVIEHYEEYVDNYPNDVLLRGEPQAISWTLNYPNFIVVVPKPGIAKTA